MLSNCAIVEYLTLSYGTVQCAHAQRNSKFGADIKSRACNTID